MDNNYFNNKLRELRKERNLTQSQVAKALGLKLNTYSHMELDGKRVSLEMLQKIADLYLIPVDSLTGKPKKPTGPYVIPEKMPQRLRDHIGTNNTQMPSFMKDLHSSEQDIILYYRMLPESEQQKILRYVERTFKKNTEEEK